jgi:hypothetical protein
MSNVKGWYVKVSTQVVFDVDTNIGVVATCEREAALEAMSIVESDLDCHSEHFKDALEKALPWELNMGGIEWNRGSMSGDIDFDTMQALSITPDPDFDPEDDDGPVSDIQGLMEAAQCLNEAFHDLPKDHPLNVWRETYGIAEVRDKLNSLAVYCDQTYRIMVDEQGYDLCFDWDFVPKFLENCVEDDFSVKSKNPRVLSMFWSGI